MLAALFRRPSLLRGVHTVAGEAAGPSGFLAATRSLAGAAGGSVADRYASLVAAGTLQHDAHQAACIERLDRLRRELHEFRQRVDEHSSRHSAHERRRAALVADLQAAEEVRLLQEEQAAAEAAAGRLGGMRSWLSAALGAEEPGEASSRQRTPAHRRALARLRAERAADEQLGPAPAPPQAPRGVYLHGSVGSGKSLLMDLLSAAVRQEGAVAHHRRLHFNGAMLEVHSRMHAIERQREQQEAEQMAAYAAAVKEQQHRDAVGDAAAAAAATLSGSQDDASLENGSSEGGGGWQQVLRLDPISQKLKRSRLARMAFRRILRAKHNQSAAQQSEALAAANASILQHAARALIRNADTLQLMSSPSAGASAGSSGAFVGPHGGSTNSSSEAGSSSGAQAEEEGGSDDEAAEEVDGQALEGPRPAAASSSSGRISALLCFDEMQISDVFSAAALKGLIEALIAEGAVIVATSNRSPAELDSHGLNELMFDHLIASLHASMDVLPLSSPTDYRRLLAASAPPLEPLGGGLEGSGSLECSRSGLEESSSSSGGTGDSGTGSKGGGSGSSLAGRSGSSALPLHEGAAHPAASYFFPLGPAAEAALEAQWRVVTASSAPASSAPASSAVDLPVMFGRRLSVGRAAGGAAWFGFEELCAQPLGPADYMAVAQAFHTVFLEGVPPFSMQVRDQARRFITLIDELYNSRARLVCSAAASPDQLFAGAGDEEPIIDLEALQFETAVEGSRLRRNLMAEGGVAPVASTASSAAAAARRLGGEEERFAFARAVSRLYEMQSPAYLASRPRAG